MGAIAIIKYNAIFPPPALLVGGYIEKMNIETLVYEMLTANTGRHMLDSGGVGGRMWERNQGKSLEDFKREPAVSFEIPKVAHTIKKDGNFLHWEYSHEDAIHWLLKYQPQSIEHATTHEGYSIEKGDEPTSKDIEYTISVFHYLTNGQLELNDICETFNALPCKTWDSDIYGVSEEQKDWLTEQGFSIGGDFNTYNGQSSLSQVLQGTYLTLDTDHYVLLQVHGGADVRGGYTDAKLFYLPNDYMPSEDVEGEIDGVPVSNVYNGYSLTRYDMDEGETDEAVPVTPESKIVLSLREY